MIDLHCHSTASDGSCEPEALIPLAEAAGLTALALTDHDTTAGLKRFRDAAVHSSVRAINGCELSCSWYHGSVHILGLFIEPEHPALCALLEKVIEQRNRRNQKLVAFLNEQGCEITLDEVEARANGGTVGRPHFAQVLVNKGLCMGMGEAFDKYLSDAKLSKLSRWLPLPADAIAAVRAAGGIAIWAHPTGVRDYAQSRTRKVAKQLKAVGLAGLEAHHSSFAAKHTLQVQQIAEELGLLTSGGSDFHGANSPGVSLGTGRGNVCVPDRLLPALEAAVERSRAQHMERV